jgi:hypothetical protein
MSTNAKQHWPPGLSPTQSEAVPSLRPAYSDRTSAMMALFCELAHDTFVADQSPADQAGAPTVAGGAGRKELKRRLEADSFRLVQVFNKDQAFLAVREGHFAILAFRGTEGKELLDTDLNLRLVPLPGVSGVMVHCGFLEVFSRCKTEIEAAVTSFALRRDRYADFLYNGRNSPRDTAHKQAPNQRRSHDLELSETA